MWVRRVMMPVTAVIPMCLIMGMIVGLIMGKIMIRCLIASIACANAHNRVGGVASAGL